MAGRDRERAGDLDGRDGALIQPAKTARTAARRRARRGTSSPRSSTATRSCSPTPSATRSDIVKKLFGGFRGYLQADASNVYDILERGPPKDSDDGVTLVGCLAHFRRYFFEAAICRYPVGVQGLLRIRAIYAADAAVRRAPAAERRRCATSTCAR